MRHFIVDVFRVVRWLARRLAARHRGRSAAADLQIDATADVVELPNSLLGGCFTSDTANDLRPPGAGAAPSMVFIPNTDCRD